ncbi:DUF2075 domain-containing protein [Myceligenerans sp. I2]|uniref:DUF2075 domain-containing protein n=2 Tax=Myceligenerans indicum TaxID=2593663 RepID=A0ABS1LKX1_9MICO|nr:DUF2075 domain-containing protein [Myceligenerans indicum]
MAEHRRDPAKVQLDQLRIIFGDSFNKSVCLDLESYLARYLHGNGQHEVTNDIRQLTSHDYHERESYERLFEKVFAELGGHGLINRSIRDIENLPLFKFSPFKTLSNDQETAVTEIVEGLLVDIEAGRSSSIVVEGAPGTGKTTVAIFLLKLLRDIGNDTRMPTADGLFDATDSGLAFAAYGSELRNRRLGMVIPQLSLRAMVSSAFEKTDGLSREMVLSPFEVGEDAEPYDVLVIDEAHRLMQRTGLFNSAQYDRFDAISNTLLDDNASHRSNALDWIQARSKHQVWILDINQIIRPSDVPASVQRTIIDSARDQGRYYQLNTQMRVRAGFDYPRYIRQVLSDEPPSSIPQIAPYDLRMYDDFGAMVDKIREREAEYGLARLVAGYAWPWRSWRDKDAFDIEIDGRSLRWNTEMRWVESPTSVDEVGSIHTVQGIDLNFAGVIIGPDLRFDREQRRLVLDRENYHDRKGKANARNLGVVYSDDDILSFVRNIYTILLTRGIRGTYVYVCDPAFRERLRPYFMPTGNDHINPAWTASLAKAERANSKLYELVRTLANDMSEHFPPPAVGPRRLYGISCLLTWSTHRVVVVNDDIDAPARKRLANAGWNVTGSDPDEVKKALAATKK